jgi:membrane protease YdiL (CAAX protease family)
VNPYRYRPLRFYGTVFLLTWLFWLAAAILGQQGANAVTTAALLLGLLVPSLTMLVTVLASQSPALKTDFKHKLFGWSRVKPLVVLASVGLFFAVIAASILLSLATGQTLSQFAFVDSFSFSIGGIPTLLTLALTALLEELGWRGYGADAIANYCSWWKASLAFGCVWSLWHLPLFLIPGTYQWEILRQNPWFMVNFLVSIIPLGFLVTWVYVKNGRSIIACVIFHFFVNLLQEEVAMTLVTKCVETAVLFIAAAVVIAVNQDLFFETRHVGNLLGGNTDVTRTPA